MQKIVHAYEKFEAREQYREKRKNEHEKKVRKPMTVYFENETEREFPFDPEEQAKKVIAFVCDHENCPV